jgi:hypothetical protein
MSKRGWQGTAKAAAHEALLKASAECSECQRLAPRQCHRHKITRRRQK